MISVDKGRAANFPPGTPENLPVRVNTRLGLEVASNYVRSTLDDNPPTPTDIAMKIKQLSNLWHLVTIEQIANADDAKLDAAYDESTRLWKEIADACK